jgi:hypothetical protein
MTTASGPEREPPWYTDPTENVKALVEVHRQHQNELRTLESTHAREMREELARRLDEKADLTASYEDRLRVKESERINAILAENAGTVQRAAEVQEAQQRALASQVATTAEASRASLAATVAPLQAAIEDLRRAQYETQGQKQQVVETRQGQTLNLNVVGALIAAIVLAIGLYATFHH